MLALFIISLFLLLIIEYISYYIYNYLCDMINNINNFIICIIFLHDNKDFINHQIMFSCVKNDIINKN